MSAPSSPILDALYKRELETAEALAAGAAELTLFEAAALGRDDGLAALLKKDPSAVNAIADDGHTGLGLASFFGRLAAVQVLLDHGADPHLASRNDMRVQPLHAAVAGRSREIVELLLDRGAEVNARQQLGFTPLMGAASAGREDLVDLLLGRGADPALHADNGETAAKVARQHGHHHLAEKIDPDAMRASAG